MYSIHNEGKSVVAEIFIRTLKTKIYKYVTSLSKNVYINKLNGIVNEYNNKNHRKIKMKPVDVENNKYIDFSKEVNDKDPQLKVGDHVRISKYRNIFAKGYTPSWSEGIFVIKKVKNTVPWAYVIAQQTFVLMKTRRLSSSSSEDVFIKTNIFALALRLQKTSWSRPMYSSWPYVFKTSSRPLQDVFKTSSRSSRRLAKISSRCSRRTIKLICSS